MRLTSLFLVLICVHVSAASRSQTVTLNVRHQPITNVLASIEAQTGYLIVYNDRYVTRDVLVSLQVADQPLETVLDQVLTPRALSYQIKGKTIAIRGERGRRGASAALPEQPIEQQRTISGKVTDEKGEPLDGVTVTVKGTSTAVTTNATGDYRVSVPGNARALVFTILGFEAAERSVGNQSTIDVALKASVSDLEEVVVVGYGTIRKADLTGAVSQVKTAQLEAAPVYNMEQALKAGATGVRVVQNSGAPGSRIEVRIRGGNSMIGDNQPLYVVDGFPVTGDITYLNPSDIESVDILKDASATAIYGARGANGVVIITSKRGKSGQNTRIDVQTQVGLQQDIKRMEVLDAREYATVVNEWLKNGGQQPFFDLNDIQGPGTDWQSEVLRNAGLQNHTITISGASEKTRYSIGGNFYDQDGIVINSGAKRGSVRVNMDHQLYDWLKMDLNINLARRERFQVPVENGSFGNTVYSGAVSAPPTLGVYDETGQLTQIGQLYSFAEATMVNPLIFDEPYKNRGLSNVVIGNTSFSIRLAEGLTLKTLLGLESHNIATEQFHPVRFANDRGAASQGNSYRTSFLNENILTYEKSFGTQHRLNLMGGFTYQDEVYRSSSIDVSGFANNNTENFNLGVAETVNPPSSGISKWALASWLARANYALADKYLFTASIRADGSSRFGENNKWAAFPSGAVAWKVNNEPFLQHVRAIDELKLRASIGMTGNSALSPYQSLNRISSVRTIYGNGAEVIGYVPSGIANPDLKWETTTQVDFGFDLTMLDNRMTITADYYIKNTTDLLASVPLPPSIGFGSMLQNIGEIRNQGFEFNVSSDILTREFKWDAAVRLSTNQNKITSLAGGNDIFSTDLNQFRSSMNIARQGYPFGMFFGLVEDGLTDAGAIKYIDQNNDGQINALDRVILGSPYPDLIYGVNSNFSYKNIELNLFIEGVTGNDIFWATAGTNLNSFQRGTNQFRDLIGNYWTAENPDPNAKYPKISSTTLVDVSDRFIEDGSYLRLKSVKLAYNLPMAKWTNAKIQRAQVYVSGINLLTFTNYPGIDPDVNTTGTDDRNVGNRLRMGIDQSAYPTAKMYMAGINFSF